MTERRREVLVLIALIAMTLLLAVVLLPLGIDEGSGRQGPGLSPRAMPRLALIGMVIALGFGLVLTLAGATSTGAPAAVLQSQDGEVKYPRRAISAVLICLAFALFGFDWLGFYMGGVAMAVLLTLLLGERQVFRVVVIPVLILALIYGVFEIGFQIRLPKADFVPGLPL